MSGPSDAFFRDIVRTVGGKLGDGLPELEKRQAAARALGSEPTLADVAVALGVMDRAKLEELGALERGTPAPRSTPSAGRVKTPSAPRAPAAAGTTSSGKRSVPICAGCKAPLALDDLVRGTSRCSRCDAVASPAPVVLPQAGKPLPVKKRLRDRAKMVSSVALQAISSMRPGKRRRAREAAAGAPPPEENAKGMAIVAGALVIALVIVTVAVVVATHSGGRTDKDQPPAIVDPTSPPVPPVAPDRSKETTAVPPVVDPTPGNGATADEERRTRLGMIAAAAVKRAKEGDFAGAEERLGALRAAAQADDREIVEDAVRTIKLLRTAADLKKLREKDVGGASK